MRAAIVSGDKKVEIVDVQHPTIRDDEVLIKVEAAGVCGSDLHLFRGTHAFRKPPAILGHEVAGSIVEIGKAVTKFRIGDRVTVEPSKPCGECAYCKQGLVNICDSKVVPGTPDWIGTFVEYFPAPESCVYKLADHVSYALGSLIEPLAVAVHLAERISVPSRDCMVILGSGSIGLLTLVMAKEMGYKQIICTDTAPYNLETALRYGATAALNPLTEDVVQRVMELTVGKGADATVVAAGSPNILTQASECTRKRGEIVLVAMITETIPFYSYTVVFREQTILGTMVYDAQDFQKAADLINGGLDLSGLITQEFDLQDSQKALEILSQKDENVVKVVVRTGA